MKTLTRLVPMLALIGCAACSDVEETAEEPSPITWTECSQVIGEHPCDFTLQDQNGQDWNLYDNYGSIIVLDFSTEWCGYCHIAAETVQEIQDDHADDNVVYVTILIEDMYGDDASVELAEKWATHYGIDAPVLAGNRDMVGDNAATEWYVTGWPRFYFIDRTMTLVHGQAGYNDDSLRMVIETLVQESAEQAVD